MTPSILTVQVKEVPLARRTWSGQLAVPTRSPGLVRFWVLTNRRSTSAVPTSSSRGGVGGRSPAPPQAATRTSRQRATRRGLTSLISAGPLAR